MASAVSDPRIFVLPPALAGQGTSDAIVRLVEHARPSVVQVRLDHRGLGAGVVWDGDGGIVTNAHVVGDARRVSLLLADGRTSEAEVLRRSRALDLALLQTSAGGLTPAYVGDSAALRVGQLVFAIGHPWGRRGVVTAGIVSACGQLDVRLGGRPADYIRSDVRLAPGNSGGPLLDANGRVVGINSMIWGGDLSVSIPAHVVLAWLANNQPGRAYLGVQIREVEVRPGSAAGLLVVGLRPEGPAEQAGLYPGDILLAVDGTRVPAPDALAGLLAARVAGASVQLEVLRGGAVQRLQVTLGAIDE